VSLEGRWQLERLGGALPPLGLVRKEIDGARGRTTFAGVSFPFDVRARELHYRLPLKGLVDVVEQRGPDQFEGEARLFGVRIGSFRMERE
jgi:hypothetical protein